MLKWNPEVERHKLKAVDFEHRLKTHLRPFALSWMGLKPFELRKDDRGFKVDHMVCLREWDETLGLYTGRRIVGCISTLVHVNKWDPAASADMVVLGIHQLLRVKEGQLSAPASVRIDRPEGPFWGTNV